MKLIIKYSIVTFFVPFAFCLVQASAYEPSAADEESRNKFNTRWFETKVPQYLEERKNEEAAYSGPTLSAAVYEEIMKHDFLPVAKKISELVDPKIYSSLQRQMRSQNLLAVLKAGKIDPQEYQVGSNSEETSLLGVYLELHTHTRPKPFAWGDVELHFSMALLDREDYHVSPFWDYGQYGPWAATPTVNKGRIAYYISKYLPTQEQNEFVFIHPVSVRDISQIVVVKGKRQKLLSEIKKHKIICPQEGGCEKLIIEREK